MRNESADPELDLLQKKYEQARDVLLRKYTIRSQAFAALSYTYFIELVGHAAATGSEQAWEKAWSQRDLCQRQLWAGHRPDAASHVKILDPLRPLLLFQETETVRLPRALAPTVVRLTHESHGDIRFEEHYLYVLTPGNDILVHAVPVPIRDLFFPEPRAHRNGVRHPQLSPGGAPVVSAGELCLFGDGGGVAAAVFNTRSGHYRPPPVSALRMLDACRETFGLDADRILHLTMGPAPEDGSHGG
ncbi:hypothetical protein AAH991_38295 [Microbispora sp. ZYX-F-249]|uniref:DUF4238 domain-containing protein n=1 Tax=Microbispora maris TaxID=3144104 RepID=A0ABV0B0I8_9ACTN